MPQEPFLGEIGIYAFGFTPRGWAQCNGQLLPINQNQALFALLGTTYGGNGTTTFALPDLRNRIPFGFSNIYPLGNAGGAASHTLIAAELPQHTHGLQGSTANGALSSPVNNLPATEASEVAPIYSTQVAGSVTLRADALAQAGLGQPHENQPPSLVLNFCIALQGIFPPRD